MSVYCIGDLHGRYDLFVMSLKEINFDIEKDKMYILGDVIDKNYGGIEIFRYVMRYRESFEFILGNHEMRFKYMEEAYDTFMLDANLKQIVRSLVDNYFNAYDQIKELVDIKIQERDIRSIKQNWLVDIWVKPSKKRVLLLETIINLIEYLDYDKGKFNRVMWVLFEMDYRYKTKQFVKELIEIDTEEYILLKEYIFSKPKEVKFNYLGKEIWLTHSLPWTRDGVLDHISDIAVKNQYVIFGHTPVPLIYRELAGKYFEFNYREVFSYIDRYNNHYYNLDMGDNCVSILRLDDFEEFYAMKYKRETNSDTINPPSEPVYERKIGYKMVNSTLPINKRPKGFSFITYKDYCMEFLIGVNKLKNEIYYSRIEYLYPNCKKFYSDTMKVISNWYNNQSVEDIIEKVIFDYKSQKDSKDIILLEKYIRGNGMES